MQRSGLTADRAPASEATRQHLAAPSTLAIAAILYTWATIQMTLAEVGQPTQRTVYEAIEQDASLSPELPLSHGTASSW